MNCPDCGNDGTSIQDTRTIEDGNTVRRRRECIDCQFRFTTYERKDWSSLRVEKQDGTTEPYDQQKVRDGIEMAVKKRPVSADTITAITADITEELKSRNEQVINATEIGSAVATRLRDLDKVAYVRFVSVYEGYSEPEEFRDVLDSIIEDADTTGRDTSTTEDT